MSGITERGHVERARAASGAILYRLNILEELPRALGGSSFLDAKRGRLVLLAAIERGAWTPPTPNILPLTVEERLWIARWNDREFHTEPEWLRAAREVEP